MKAYKFLAAGAVGPFSGFVWPPPSAGPKAWVEVEGRLATCERGVHVCRPEDLVHWIHEELWEVEFEGETQPGVDSLVARRARLVRRIDAWSGGGAKRFVMACGEHANALSGASANEVVRGFLDDAEICAAEGFIALGALCAALAVTNLASTGERERAYREERAWQAAWIARELLGP
jgi:hypothetical protein